MRNLRFGLMMSSDEKESLRRLAQAEGTSAADVIRRLLKRAAQELVATEAPPHLQSSFGSAVSDPTKEGEL